MKWPDYQLFRLAERFVSGGTPSTKIEEHWGGDIPWITGADFNDGEIVLGRRYINQTALNNSASNIVPKGSVLMVTRTGVGKIAIAPADVAISQDITGIILKHGVSAQYVIAAIKNKMVVLLAAQRGATIKGVTRKDVENLPIPLPAPSEQRRIVEILDQADLLRRKRAEADVKTTRIVPALFYQMFSDPATNPKGWHIKPLSDLEAQVRYGLGQPPKASESGVALIRATNISRGTISVTNMIYVDPQNVPPGRNAFLKEDEVIVVRSGAYTGDVAQVTKEWEGCVAGYDLVITPGKRLTGEFIEAYLLTSFIQKGYFQNLKARAGQPHLNATQVAATPFLDVPHDLQVRFSEAVQSARALRKRIETASKNLERVFIVVLHQAFTGNLTTKWREAHMKELLAEMEMQARELNQGP